MIGHILILLTGQYFVEGILVVNLCDEHSCDKNLLNKVDLYTGILVPYEDFTLCINFKIFTSFEYGSIFKDKNTHYELFLHAKGSYGIFNWLNKSYIFEIPQRAISLYEWAHFCISFNQTHYWVVSDGTLWFEFTRYAIPQPELLEPSIVSFGMGMGEAYQVSNMNIWSVAKSYGKQVFFCKLFLCNIETENHNIKKY